MTTRLLLDPWSADYSPSFLPDATPGPQPQIDTTPETPHWAALPAAGPAPAAARFIDGVRRLEARLVGWRDSQPIHGLFASFATGAITVTPTRATVTHAFLHRRLVLSAGLSRSVALPLGNTTLAFEPLPTPGDNPSDLVLALQNAMREAEAALAASFPDFPVYLDGPLAFLTEPPGPVTGVIKSIHTLYLDPAHMDLVFQLRPAERTPVFSVRDGAKQRYSSYSRIASASSIHHALAGILRLEARAANGIEAAVALADASAAFLPRFASTPARDPRAPQNLTPVGALEDHLRNLLGDPTLIQRAIQQHIAAGLSV